ncbi:hypothetical protein LTS08_002609 [Lithohypha guttulata]|nr:hypothetical protein LTS08_002609 [Lithohypha guttulata]
MPPKRKVPARRASTGKRVSFGGNAVLSQATTPSGRPKRSVTNDVMYKLPSRNSNAAYVSATQQAKVGQDAVAAPIPASPKRRGRPPKSAVGTVTTTPKKAGASPKAVTPTAGPVAGKKRGRPAAATKENAPDKASTTTAAPVKVPGRRGRPKAEPQATPAAPTSNKRKRDEEEVAAPPRKRGRPSSGTTAAPAAKATRNLAVKIDKSSPKTKTTTQKSKAVVTKPAGKRGPKPGTKRGPRVAKDSSNTAVEDFTAGLTSNDLQYEGDDQYWLMKAEPETRMVKGIDVAFSIDKLAKAAEPEPWDGVRNAVARNNMRAMRRGDLAFFYHSNCDVPGIFGVMRVAEEHAVDESAFDPQHPYYDEKSTREKPKWDCVKVEFVKKFSEPITLKTIKSTKKLGNMLLVQPAGSRLSVQKVRPDEWKFVLKMANESEDLGVADKKSGYEADTNGETDKEAAEESVGVDEDIDMNGAADFDVDAAKIAAYGSPDDFVDDGEGVPVAPEPEDQLALEAGSNGVVPDSQELARALHN